MEVWHMPALKPAKEPARNVGVRLQESVLKYLDDLAVRDDRSRNYLVNRIIREHAALNDSSTVGPRKKKLAEARG